MAFLPTSQLVINYDSGVSPATTQTYTWTVSTQDASPQDMVIYLFADLTQSGGSGSPTSELRLYTSADGSVWVRVRLDASTDGTTVSKQVSQEIAPTKYLRLSVVPGGSTAPVVVAKAIIACDASLTLTAVS